MSFHLSFHTSVHLIDTPWELGWKNAIVGEMIAVEHRPPRNSYDNRATLWAV